RVLRAIECAKCVDSPNVPTASDYECKATCTGGFCYRAEYAMKYHARSPNATAVLTGCMEYTIGPLTLGCRRNFEGIVLCVWFVLECEK
ncbi:hypothetical protein PFISCL1PPCAC_12947, partial [Pristionchus fissidentatus]